MFSSGVMEIFLKRKRKEHITDLHQNCSKFYNHLESNGSPSKRQQKTKEMPHVPSYLGTGALRYLQPASRWTVAMAEQWTLQTPEAGLPWTGRTKAFGRQKNEQHHTVENDHRALSSLLLTKDALLCYCKTAPRLLPNLLNSIADLLSCTETENIEILIFCPNEYK